VPGIPFQQGQRTTLFVRFDLPYGDSAISRGAELNPDKQQRKTKLNP
jgi:hypothetical protein